MANQQELEQYLKLISVSDSTAVCPVKYTLDIIGGKWKLRILVQLLSKKIIRFNELKREISGITNTMLSNSLHELEFDKIIIRTQYNEMPLRVEYSLTDSGEKLLPLLYELSNWGRNRINGT